MAPKEAKIWWLYVLECEDGTLYTGISPDPQGRFDAHRAGKGAAYTRAHPPKKLILVEKVGTYGEALRREYQVKRLSRDEKRRFVANPRALPRP